MKNIFKWELYKQGALDKVTVDAQYFHLLHFFFFV